jgi:Primase X
LTRIPGSHNSKCILEDKYSEVKILQKWDGIRPSIKGEVLYENRQKLTLKISQMEASKYYRHSGESSILWIEKLLKTPIEDYRKNAVSLILAPYLINIRNLSDGDASDIIEEWLKRCASLRPLDSTLRYRVKYDLNNAIKNGIPLMKLDTLKQKNRLLYDKLEETC